jgi:hypothetical protein
VGGKVWSRRNLAIGGRIGEGPGSTPLPTLMIKTQDICIKTRALINLAFFDADL